jgi:hypothetical protein
MDLFVKAAPNADGSLFFDALRLIACQPVKYTQDGDELAIKTFGLNLDQLGYLRKSDSIYYTEEMREQLKLSYADQFFANLANIKTVADNDFEIRKTELLLVGDKLAKLANFADNINESLKKLQARVANGGITEDSIKGLIKKYFEISDKLATENALYQALEDNKDTDALEQHLISMLEELTTIETAQQALFDELDQLKTTVIDSIKIAEHDILMDFNRHNFNNDNDSSYKAFIEAQLKNESIKRVEAEYNNGLDTVASSLSSIVNLDSRNLLTNILDNLRLTKSSVLRQELSDKIARIIITYDRSALDTYLSTCYTAATRYNYNELLKALTDLRGYLGYSSVGSLVNELAAVVESNNDARLAKLLADIIDKLDEIPEAGVFENLSFDKTQMEAANVFYIIDWLSAKAKYKIEQETEEDSIDSDIISALSLVDTKAIGNYNTELNTLLDETLVILTDIASSENTIANIQTSYTDMITAVSNTKDAQIANTINALTEVISQRTNNLDSVADFSLNADKNKSRVITGLPFGKEALLVVWSVQLETALYDYINSWYDGISEVISNESTEVSQPECPSAVINRLVPSAQFKALWSRATTIHRHKEQRDSIKNVVELISDNTFIPQELKNFEDNSDTPKRYRIMAELCNAIENTTDISIVQKQELIRQLQVELDNSRSIDTQLLEVIAGLLCPGILMPKKELAEAFDAESGTNFYEKLATAVEDLCAQLRNAVSDENTFVLSGFIEEVKTKFAFETEITDFSLAASLTNSSFKEWLGMSDEDFNIFKTISLLPDTFLDLISALRDRVITSKLTDYVKQKLEKPTTLAAYENGDAIKDMLELAANDYAVCSELEGAVTTLCNGFNTAYDMTITDVSDDFIDAYEIYETEQQLLRDILEVDVDNEFYYNVPIEAHFAIEFNENSKKQNTLMNPAFNYDINNINNNFVISKIDINYLDSGIQIARASKVTY